MEYYLWGFLFFVFFFFSSVIELCRTGIHFRTGHSISCRILSIMDLLMESADSISQKRLNTCDFDPCFIQRQFLSLLWAGVCSRRNMYFSWSWNSCEILVLLGYVQLPPLRQDSSSPLWDSCCCDQQEFHIRYLCRLNLHLCLQNGIIPASLFRQQSCFLFDPIVTLELWNIFCRVILALSGHYVLLMWGRRTQCECQLLLQFLFTRVHPKWKKKPLNICPMVKDKIWKWTFKDQVLHLA